MARNDNGRSRRIDINRADADELAGIEGIDGDHAEVIVRYRSENGPFESWDEVEQIEGIGPVLTEKLREAAELGRGAEQLGIRSIVGNQRGAKTIEEEELEELTEGEVLMSVARLDLEAALAYGAAAEGLEDQRVRSQLLRFRDDHLRHIRELNPQLVARGRDPIDPSEVERGDLLLPGLARLVLPLGNVAALMALLSNEQMTNLTYEAALEFDWDDEIVAILERAAADETRHLSWLAEEEDRISGAYNQPSPFA